MSPITKQALSNRDALIETMRLALQSGIDLAESGGHGSGADCPTCHFVRQAKRALGQPVPDPKASKPQ